ncbi:MAG: hypothetical protein ACEQSB_00010 [Undibacterium sp.]
MKKSELIDLFSKSGDVRVSRGIAKGGGDYWLISLSYPSVQISGYGSFELCAEAAIEYKARKLSKEANVDE